VRRAGGVRGGSTAVSFGALPFSRRVPAANRRRRRPFSVCVARAKQWCAAPEEQGAGRPAAGGQSMLLRAAVAACRRPARFEK